MAPSERQRRKEAERPPTPWSYPGSTATGRNASSVTHNGATTTTYGGSSRIFDRGKRGADIPRNRRLAQVRLGAYYCSVGVIMVIALLAGVRETARLDLVG